VFTNAGIDGRLAFSLALPNGFVTDMRSGSEVGLYLTATDANVGFTFNSRNFGNTNAQPVLEVTAVADPQPIINSIVWADGNVRVSFSAVTNWTYRLQRSNGLGESGGWTDVLMLPAQASPTNVVYIDGVTNSRAFYRLCASQ
jgi:hypothetical protein